MYMKKTILVKMHTLVQHKHVHRKETQSIVAHWHQQKSIVYQCFFLNSIIVCENITPSRLIWPSTLETVRNQSKSRAPIQLSPAIAIIVAHQKPELCHRCTFDHSPLHIGTQGEGRSYVFINGQSILYCLFSLTHLRIHHDFSQKIC